MSKNNKCNQWRIMKVLFPKRTMTFEKSINKHVKILNDWTNDDDGDSTTIAPFQRSARRWLGVLSEQWFSFLSKNEDKNIVLKSPRISEQ